MGFTMNTDFIKYIDNPIYASIIIVVIIIIIVWWFFYIPYSESVDIDEYPQFWKVLLRSGIWISIGVTTLISLHYKSVTNEYRDKQESKSLKNIVESTTGVEETLKIGEGEVDIIKDDASLITSDNIIILQK